MEKEFVLFRKEGAIAYVTINREEALNALNREIMERLDGLFYEMEKDDGIMVVIITGAGKKAFVAGADVREIKEAGPGRTAFIKKGQEILSKIRRSSKVVIAAVNGYALGGGCELALACDIRFASENARFGLPESTLGVMAGYGGTQLLSRLIGWGRAKYIMFSGNMITAQEAYEYGLVERVCTQESLIEEVEALAKKISTCGPLSLKGTKKAIDEGLQMPLEKALEYELELYDYVANSKDAEEGLSAFLEKRKPVFQGR
ncbi:MAG: enoyl-CoA hydratase-related protein [Syntrophorhabdaceae bacterium]|nr:enoyl-CoA hydratase-related protein [Syntrophorhabdaceae bacterium]